ncbi:MAG: AMP-dependent synthetase and ligase, partial [Klenkia sp.]|nr:AMP-dependent synthetase and ligase [Klenkia sp.]
MVHGDRVAVPALDGLEVVETHLATVRLGATAVPVNSRPVADEVAHVLADSGAVALVNDPATAETARTARDRAPAVTTVPTIGPEYEAALAAADPTPVEHVVVSPIRRSWCTPRAPPASP